MADNNSNNNARSSGPNVEVAAEVLRVLSNMDMSQINQIATNLNIALPPPQNITPAPQTTTETPQDLPVNPDSDMQEKQSETLTPIADPKSNSPTKEVNPTNSGSQDSPSQSTPPAKAQKGKKENTPTVPRRSARTAFRTVRAGETVDLVEEEEDDEEAESKA